LVISIRAQAYTRTRFVEEKIKAEKDEYSAYRNRQPDLEPGRNDNEHAQWVRYLFDNPTTFITVRETGWLSVLLPTLTLVRFAIIFEVGAADPGVIAQNLTPAVKTFRERVISKAFPTPDERVRFNAFLSKVIAARNGLIAHSDGRAIGIVKEGNFEKMRTASTPVATLNLKQFLADVEAIQASLNEELRAIDPRRAGPPTRSSGVA